MTEIFIYASIVVTGIFYFLLSRNKLVYINAPEKIISSKLKWKFLRIHIILSFALGVAIINLLIRLLQPDLFDWLKENGYYLTSILSSTAISFFIVAACIQFYLRQHNSEFAYKNEILNNPDMLQPDQTSVTSELMDETKFWKAVLPLSNPGNKKIFHDELRSYSPKNIMEFYNTLIEYRAELIRKGLHIPYQYIFRKFEGNMEKDFLDFIISQGKEKYQEAMTNPDSIANLKFSPVGIRNLALEPLLAQVYKEKTGKLLSTFRPAPDLYQFYSVHVPPNYVEENLPNVFRKFK